MRLHHTMLGRFKSWIKSSDVIRDNHIRILIPTLIGWFSWIVRNDSKHRGKRVNSQSIISIVMSFIHLSHFAQAFSMEFWVGYLSTIANWLIL